MAAKRKKPVEESLTSALARLLEKTILPDLAARAKLPAVAAVLAEQHAREKAASRTADTLAEWTPRWLEQIGAAWILSCVFLRTLEDRGLVRHRRLAGEGAADAEQLFFEIAPSLTARDYLLTAFREVARHPGAEELLGPGRNPAFRLSPSNEGARALLDFFRQGEDGGKGLRWRFEGRDTRFLGDLYQDLSASVRERYALLQTPIFVEEFILDLTLEPAIKTYGLEETHLIDPTCGSGHFLLGAFERICEHRMRTAPGVDAKVHAWAALGQVHGVDLNPYAVAIARFRLTLAYLDKAGMERLSQVPKRLPLEVVVADSLLHGGAGTTGFLAAPRMAPSVFELEDPEAAGRVFGRRYQAVVGNPPYITCKDAVLREVYRARYVSASGKYALAAPFTERFFQLGLDGGYVGLINANSFMKREFGKKLIENVLRHIELTRVIDASGAFIPGHGTPTVLLFGRNRKPLAASVRAVMGKRGEPTAPDEPQKGLVWSAIQAHFDQVPFENDFISTAEIPRTTFHKHPWALGGGGAAGLRELLEDRGIHKLEEIADSIGITSFTLEDDVYIRPRHAWKHVDGRWLRAMIIGEAIRDWAVDTCDSSFFPYDHDYDPIPPNADCLRIIWAYRTNLANNKLFGGKTKVEGGLHWYEYGRLTVHKLRTPLAITFAEVATHNHFVLERGGKVFKQTAPIVKLPEAATDEDHLVLLAYLNSSTAGFWMKQVSHDKGAGTDSGKWQPDRAKIAFAFGSSRLGGLPVPSFSEPSRGLLIRLAKTLIELVSARQICMTEKIQQAALDCTTHDELKACIQQLDQQAANFLERAVVCQEEIDWIVYEAFGLRTGMDSVVDEIIDEAAASPLGARPFEIFAARRGQDIGLDGQALRCEPAESLPIRTRATWRARVDKIQSNAEIALIEQPNYKRRWLITPKDMGGAVQSFMDVARGSLHSWILDAIEDVFKGAARILGARELLEAIHRSGPVLSATKFFAGDESIDLPGRLMNFVHEDGIPYLAALRHTDDGLDVHAQWEHTWALQRREDSGEKLPSPIPVPEKYDAKDFRDANYFRLRGKLDVPKERFISYPGAETDDDRSPLFGWAGWDHLQRATALAGLYQHRKTEEGWGADRLTPLLAGILELVPWLKQWHNEMNQDFGERLGDYYERYVDTEARSLGLTLDALRAWRPEAKGRKPRGPKGAT